jgi:hypothetical protein
MNSLNPLIKSNNKTNQNKSIKSSSVLEINVMKLDEFLLSEGIDYVDFMKIDVQGGEFRVLQGATHYLQNKKIELIQLEFIKFDLYENQVSIDWYLNFMMKYDYHLLTILDLAYDNSGYLNQVELFFCSQKRKGK